VIFLSLGLVLSVSFGTSMVLVGQEEGHLATSKKPAQLSLCSSQWFSFRTSEGRKWRSNWL